MRKIIALLISVTIIIGLAASAMAGSITITRDATYASGSSGTPRNYIAYKVFDADTALSGTNTQADKQPTYGSSGTAVAYTMAIDSPWVDVMTGSGSTWFDVKLSADGSVYVITAKEGLTDSDAAAIAAYLKDNLPSGLSGTTVEPGTATEVDNGYYLILASDGATNLTLVTTDVTIVEKNTYLNVKKETAETSYKVGDIVEYKVTVDVPSDADTEEPIILHDVMDTVLLFKDDIAAKVGDAAFTDFTVTAPAADGDTFDVSIDVTNVLGKTITFTYSAEVTSAAAEPDTGFVNKLFGEKNGYETVPSTPRIYTFDFGFNKTFEGSTDESLVATFELRTTANDSGTAIALIPGSGSGTYVVADSSHSGSTTITSANNANIYVEGLKAGTYYLVELSTSTGYNLLEGPVEVVITDTTTSGSTPSHTYTVDGKSGTSSGTVAIVNKAGTILPSTGGIGTTIFYIVGGLLAVGAGVVLVTKKRMGKEDI